MKTALFTNFSNEVFTGFWDGKGRKFEAGESQWMPDYLARHFAKHLTNRELFKLGKERATSPKKPEDVPEFMTLFNQAYTPDADADVEFAAEKDSIDVQIAMANKNRQQKTGKSVTPLSQPTQKAPDVNPVLPKPEKEQWKEDAKAKPDPTKAQVILPPDFDDDEEDISSNTQVEPTVSK